MFKENKFKIIMILLLCMVVVSGFKVLSAHNNNLYKVSFLNVGQGDAIFMQTPNKYQILIDGGPDDSVLEELRLVMPLGDKSIDLLLLSHADADHLTGLVEVIQDYDIGGVIMPEFPKQSQLYKAWIEVLTEYQIPVTMIKNEQLIKIDSRLEFHFLHPSLETLYPKISVNNASLVFIATIGAVDFLFTGDIEEEVEEKLVEAYHPFEIELLKAPHHGSKSSSSQDFLYWVEPEVVVIQSGAENKFGHPHNRVLHRYEQLSSQVFRNDLSGVLHFSFDETSINQLRYRSNSFPQLFGFELKTVYTTDD
mgnify:CR=1 FL=1|jgi:competence protein ComEC